MSENEEAAGRALNGVRVLDLSNLYAGPMVSTIMGDFGADVIKTEHPRGDDARRWGLSKEGIPLWWKILARNKRLMKIDLNSDEDRKVVRHLVAEADVVIENFRPGRMESWGLGYEDLKEINPGIVMLRVTGFGQYGPLAQEPGFGTLAEAFSGFAYITGQADGPPTLPPFGLADGVAALTGVYGVMMALYWRDAAGGQGEGQCIDLSLYEPLFSILGPQVAEYTQRGIVQRRQGNRSPRTAPRNTFATSDGRWVATSAGTQSIANRIFEAIGLPALRHDENFSTPAARRANADAVDEIMTTAIASMPLDEVVSRFRKAAAPIAPVQSIDQIVEDPHYLARQTIIDIADPDLGVVTMQAPVPRLSNTPARIAHAGKINIDSDGSAIRSDGWSTPDPEEATNA